MSSPTKVYLTRPENQAQPWLDAIRAAGFEAENIALLRIAPVSEQAQLVLRQVWTTLQTQPDHYAAVMFVSRAAVEYFFAAKPLDAVFIPQAWCTGQGTRQALLEQGLTLEQIVSPMDGAVVSGGDAGTVVGVEAGAEPSFDSEGLWAVLERRHQNRPTPPAQTVLFVRGGDATGQAKGRDWLELSLQEKGFLTETCVAYLRLNNLDGTGLHTTDLDKLNSDNINLDNINPDKTDTNKAQLLQAYASNGIWVFSSSLALDCLPTRDWQTAKALATHERIARKATEKGFKQVQVCSPVLTNVLQALQSMA